MAKSKIIKQLANNEISIEVALKRLFVIASDIGNKELANWAESEINGYKNIDLLPSYRIVENTVFIYSGILGNYQVTNSRLPVGDLFADNKKLISLNVTDGLKSIQDCLDKKVSYGVDVTYLASEFQKVFNIRFFSITQTIPVNEISNVISTISTIMIKVFIELEKEYGNLDELDIDVSGKTLEEIKKVNTIINQFIYNDNSISIGDKNKISDSKINSSE